MAETASQRPGHPVATASTAGALLLGTAAGQVTLPGLQKQKETFTWTGGPSSLQRSGQEEGEGHVSEEASWLRGREVPG